MAVKCKSGETDPINWADVVGPDRDAGLPGNLGDMAAAREEIDKGWEGGAQ